MLATLSSSGANRKRGTGLARSGKKVRGLNNLSSLLGLLLCAAVPLVNSPGSGSLIHSASSTNPAVHREEVRESNIGWQSGPDSGGSEGNVSGFTFYVDLQIEM